MSLSQTLLIPGVREESGAEAEAGEPEHEAGGQHALPGVHAQDGQAAAQDLAGTTATSTPTALWGRTARRGSCLAALFPVPRCGAAFYR